MSHIDGFCAFRTDQNLFFILVYHADLIRFISFSGTTAALLLTSNGIPQGAILPPPSLRCMQNNLLLVLHSPHANVQVTLF